MSQQESNTPPGNGAPLIINGGVGGVVIKGGDGGSHGDGGTVNLKAGDGGDVRTIENPVFAGGETWVDRAYDPHFQTAEHENLSTETTEHSPKSNSESSPKYWYQKPIGLIGLTVVSGLLVLTAAYLIRHHFGIL